jgi:glycosyltransferase involved in cell wall biosynthesis
VTRRVAYFDHTAALGGAEVALLNLIGAIDRGRWEPIAVIGEDGPLVRKLTQARVPVDILRLPGTLRRVRQGQIRAGTPLNPGRIAMSVWYVSQLIALLRRNRVDLIHTNSLRAAVLGGIAGRIAGIPTIWQIHSVVGSPLMSPSGVRLLRLLSRYLPERIICNSRATAKDFEAAGGRVTVVPCGVDSMRFEPNGPPLQSHQRIGMIARFAPVKGQHVFVEAARELSKRHPGAEFVLAGSALFGEERYEEQVRTAALSVENQSVQFLGFVEDVPRLMKELDILVNPSTQPEGFGQVIVEAMMAGKPVIASAAGGPLDVVEDGVTGRLIPPDDAQALGRAMGEMLDQPEQAAMMGRLGRERALQRFDIRETTRQVEQVYEMVISRA